MEHEEKTPAKKTTQDIWSGYWERKAKGEQQQTFGKKSALGPERRKKIDSFVLKKLEEILAGHKDPTVLEIGAGPGKFSEEIHERFGVPVVAIDFAGTRERAGVHSINANFSQLPLKNASIHAVISVFAMEYSDRPTALKEIHRVLKDGGQAVMVIHKPDSVIRRDVLEGASARTKELITLREELSKSETVPPKKMDLELLKKLKDEISDIESKKQFNEHAASVMGSSYRDRESILKEFGESGLEVLHAEPLEDLGWSVVARKRLGKP